MREGAMREGRPIFIGIDPGNTGAIAIVEMDGRLGAITKMPTEKHPANMTTVDGWALHQMLQREAHSTTPLVAIERAQPMPRQGVKSVFTYGVGYGVLFGVVASLGLPLCTVRPQEWKKEYSLSSDKKAAIDEACRLFPKLREIGKVTHGMAEAALIAEWARRYR